MRKCIVWKGSLWGSSVIKHVCDMLRLCEATQTSSVWLFLMSVQFFVIYMIHPLLGSINETRSTSDSDESHTATLCEFMSCVVLSPHVTVNADNFLSLRSGIGGPVRPVCRSLKTEVKLSWVFEERSRMFRLFPLSAVWTPQQKTQITPWDITYSTFKGSNSP